MMVGLLSGGSFSFVLGLGSAMEHLSLAAYVEIHQSMSPLLDSWMLSFYLLLVAFLFLDLFYLRHEWQSLEFVLVFFALLCICDEFAMTWNGNMPLDHVIKSWHMQSPPPDWMEIRSQWLRFMYLRSVLLVAGFGLLLSSTFFIRKNQASQQDVFAVV